MNCKRRWSKAFEAALLESVSVCVCAEGEGCALGWKVGEVLMFMPLTYLCNSSNGVGKLLQ